MNACPMDRANIHSGSEGRLIIIVYRRLNMPDYYSFREFIGSAKTVEKLGEVSLTLKNSILASCW